jgi:hypothetical protein
LAGGVKVWFWSVTCKIRSRRNVRKSWRRWQYFGPIITYELGKAVQDSRLNEAEQARLIKTLKTVSALVESEKRLFAAGVVNRESNYIAALLQKALAGRRLPQAQIDDTLRRVR